MDSLGRLLYVSGYRLDHESGFAEHIREIATHLAHLGWQVTLVGPAAHAQAVAPVDPADPLTVVTVPPRQAEHGLGALALWRAVAQLLQRQAFDLAYMRPARKTLFVPWWLGKKGVPLFVEVNTNIVGEYLSFGKGRLEVALVDWTEKFQFQYAAGAFCVTNELALYAKGRVPDGAKVWVTGNGFRAELTELAAFDAAARGAVGVPETATVVTFLGRLGIWQGVDLVLEALVALPDVWLWIIGDGPERPRLEELAQRLGVDGRVHWFGYQQGAALQALLNATDIGIGTLAMQRKQMTEAQSLKVRHYLGVGLPTLIGYNDTLLDDRSPGVFYAQTPEAVAERIREIDRRGNARSLLYRQEIREFALQHLSWTAIARQTSEILSRWLAAHQPRGPR